MPQTDENPSQQKAQVISHSNVEAILKTHSASFIDDQYSNEDIVRTIHAPIVLAAPDATELTERVKQYAAPNDNNRFLKPFDGAAALFSIDETDPRFNDAQAIINSLAGPNGDGYIAQQAEATREFFTHWAAEISRFSPAITSGWSLHKKGYELDRLYHGYKDASGNFHPGLERLLYDRHQQERDEFNKWFDNNLKYFKAVYAANLDTEEKIAQFRQTLLKQITDRQGEERSNYLDNIARALNKACADIAGVQAKKEALYTAQHTPNGLASFKDDSSDFNSDELTDRYGNAYKITNGKTTCDFTRRRYSETEKRGMMQDRIIALRQQQKAVMEKLISEGKPVNPKDFKINISASVRSPEDTWLDNKNPTYVESVKHAAKMLNQQWKECIIAGLSPDEIGVPPGFTPSVENEKFARKFMCKESYKALALSNPTIYKLLSESASYYIKHADLAHLHGYLAPILTVDEVAAIQALDMSKIKNIKELRAALDEIRPGIGYGLKIDSFFSSEKSYHDEVLASLHADKLFNPVIRDLFKYAKTPEGNRALETDSSDPHTLTQEQITAINRLDFSDCKTKEEIIHKLDNIGHGKNPGWLKELDFTALIPKGDLNISRALPAFNAVSKVQAGQRVAEERFSATVDTSDFVQQIKKADEEMKVDIDNINNTPKISDRKTTGKTLSGDEFVSIAENYNHLLWLAEAQLDRLAILSDKLRRGLHLDQHVVDSFAKLYQGTMETVDKAKMLLNSAGNYVTNAEIQNHLPEQLKNSSGLPQWQKAAERLDSRQAEIHRNFNARVGASVEGVELPSPSADNEDYLKLSSGRRR